MEINANLAENDFRIKEINAEQKVTFQNKGNGRDVYKETKLVETTGLKLNLKSEMDTFFWLGSFLERTKGLREEIRPLQVLHSFSVTGGTPP